jgi:hypothetical protein
LFSRYADGIAERAEGWPKSDRAIFSNSASIPEEQMTGGDADVGRETRAFASIHGAFGARRGRA